MDSGKYSLLRQMTHPRPGYTSPYLQRRQAGHNSIVMPVLSSMQSAAFIAEDLL